MAVKRTGIELDFEIARFDCIVNKTGSASVLMPQYDVSYEIIFPTSD